MTTLWDPALISESLVDLTRSLGEPAKDLVILAEGNTSERLPDGRVAVKASGVHMGQATNSDFVVAEVQPLIDLMMTPSTTQDDLTAALDAGEHDGVRRRGSIETLIHVGVQSVSPATFIAHTHPTSAVSLLASVHAQTAFDTFVYSDEVVVIGRPLFVPYAAPGIDLGRLFITRLRDYFSEYGTLPSLILLGNHGIVAISETAESAEAISLMAVKGSRVRLNAYAAGGVTGLGAEVMDTYFARADYIERRQQLAGTN